MKPIMLNLVVLACTSKKQEIMPILTLMNPSISPPNYWYPPLIK